MLFIKYFLVFIINCLYIIVVYMFVHIHLTKKFNSYKYASKNNIIPIAFSVFSIIFVGYVLVGAIEHYLTKYIF